MNPARASLLALALLACAGRREGGDEQGAVPDAATLPRGDLPTLHPSDPARAEAGRRFLFDEWPGGGLVPAAAIYNLPLVWGTGPLAADDMWLEFERRYGFFRAPGAELPLGFHATADGQISLSCLACHADRGPAGEILVGAANRRLDFRRLFADGQALADLFGVEAPTGSIVEGLQVAPGALDAIGLGFQLTTEGSGLNQRYGFQQSAAWWSQRVKRRQFADGDSQVENWRTTMATLVAFGWSEERISSYDETFKDLQQYLFSLAPPAWSGAPPDAALVAAGEALFDATCARCHGVYHGGQAAFPDRVVALAEIGTDPLRAEAMGAAEVAALNASWFAVPGPFEDTAGYLAPSLLGVWATAPYFHNGSVPDLAGVIDSSDRPAIWQLDDPPAYDEARVGWAASAAVAGDPRAYDTAIPGLGNGGHTFGDGLDGAERAALLAYLKTL